MYCQVVYLRGCHPGRIRRALEGLPKTLDETYERTLREINDADWELAHRLFQCVAVASRPLRVDELAEFLAFDFKAGSIPKFHEGWRVEDPLDAVLSTCPSLLIAVKVGDSQIIQFSHFSVKEFLTSTRLAETKHVISRYHVSMTPAHTLAAQSCLGILIHWDKNIIQDSLPKFALASYAALHWADHARFEDVSRDVEDGMKNLFDPRKPHLTAWVSLHNAELPAWKLIKRGEQPLPYSGTALHYATVCGLDAFVKVLVVERQHDVDSRSSDNLTPLLMASLRGHEEVVRVLLDCGADVAAKNEDGWTPLHVASFEGHFQVVRVLLEYGASTTAKDRNGSTPLHLALQVRHVDVPQVILDHSADTRSEDEDEYGGPSPLHDTSPIDLISFMFSQGASCQVACDFARRCADATAQGEDGNISFEAKDVWAHLASRSGHVEVVQCLVKHGADPTAQDKDGWTPLHSVSQEGQVEVAQFLIKHGADVTAQDKDLRTPLHSASQEGHVEVARFLVENRADATAQDKDGWTPLHWASEEGHMEVAQFLVEHGVDATAQDKEGWTPLHSASREGCLEVAQFLVKHSADATAQNKDGLTPLHSASRGGHIHVVRFLVEHGADATAQNKDGSTPLHSAAREGHLEVVQFLIEHGADASARKKDGWTPLHSASRDGHPNVVRFLVEHGADTTARNHDGRTPLHSASFKGHIEIVQFLVKHGADVRAQNKDGRTPLDFASRERHVEITRFLIEHGAEASAQSKAGQTPLYLTSQKGHVEGMQFLHVDIVKP